MSMPTLGYTLEEQVDFEISIGLFSQSERQGILNELYKSTAEILADMQSASNDSIE